MAARWLQPRYRALALAAVLAATADLFRARARMLAAGPREATQALPLQDWMQRQVTLDERVYQVQVWIDPVAGYPNVHRVRVRTSWNGRQVEASSSIYAI